MLVGPFWRLGKALIVVNGIGALTMQSFPWLLGAVAGVAAVGSFQALLAVMGFTNPLMIAVNSLITTHAARAQGLDPPAKQRAEFGIIGRYAVAGGIPLVAYCLALWIAPSSILQLFFGPTSPYRSLVTELRVLVLFSTAQYAYFVLAGVLNARQDTRALLRAQIAGAVTVPLLAVPLIIATGSILAAAVGLVISAIVRAGVATRAILAVRPGVSRLHR